MAINFFSFCVSEKNLFSLHFYKDIFTEYKILNWQLFSFRALKMPHYCLLAYIVLATCLLSFFTALFVVFLLFPPTFNICSLILICSSFIIMYLTVYVLSLSLYHCVCVCVCIFILLVSMVCSLLLGKIPSNPLFKYTYSFAPIFSLLSLWTLSHTYIWPSDTVPQFLDARFCHFIFLSLFQFGSFLLIYFWNRCFFLHVYPVLL